MLCYNYDASANEKKRGHDANYVVASGTGGCTSSCHYGRDDTIGIMTTRGFQCPIIVGLNTNMFQGKYAFHSDSLMLAPSVYLNRC